MSSTVITITMPDILYEPYRLDTTTAMAQLTDFSLCYEQLYTLLQAGPACMLAGGAAANIFHNYLNPDNPKPMDPHADLDFWMYDPNIDAHHDHHRYEMFDVFNHTLTAAGYVQHHRHPAIAVWYQQAFKVQGNTRIRCNWWAHPVSGKRIQLIFTSTPPNRTLLNFDLPVCRAAITAQDGVFYLQWTGQCEKVMRDRLMLVPSTEAQTPLLVYRIAKYAERYDIKLFPS
jgi:hypothetical protein